MLCCTGVGSIDIKSPTTAASALRLWRRKTNAAKQDVNAPFEAIAKPGLTRLIVVLSNFDRCVMCALDRQRGTRVRRRHPPYRYSTAQSLLSLHLRNLIQRSAGEKSRARETPAIRLGVDRFEKSQVDGNVGPHRASLVAQERDHHGGLAEHLETLTVVRKLVEKGTLPKPAAVAKAVGALPAATLGTPKASRIRTNKFIDEALAGTLKKGDPGANDPEVWRRILEEAQLC